ncbi:MAG: protein kinase domain-containing protein [Caldilineaceae bacterium]
MKIRLWGTRGSMATPIEPPAIEEKICQAILALPKHFDTRDADAVRNFVSELPVLLRGTAGGNTSCVEIQSAGETFIVDSGTGIRNLGLELAKGPCGRGEGRLHIFISHLHWDHIQGFTLFLPAFIAGNHITFYSVHNLEWALTEQQRYPWFPVSFTAEQAEQALAQLDGEQRRRYGPIPYMLADRDFVRLKPGESTRVGPVTVNTIRNHHPGDSYSYRFEDQSSVFVYASDSEYKDLDDSVLKDHIHFFRGADALLFDAQYGLRESWESKADYGHSSAMIGVDLARRAGVKRLLLTHHEPTHSDVELTSILNTAIAYQSQDPTLPYCEIRTAYEGLELDLAPPEAIHAHLDADKETTILSAGGTFDMAGAEQVWERLSGSDAADDPVGSVLDMSQVERMTTASLKALVTAAGADDGALVLAAPSTEVQRVIELAGYGDFFAIYPTVAEAVQAVKARKALGLPGQVIDGHYQIVDMLGRDSFSTVLRVTESRSGQDLALRVIRPAFSRESVENLMAYGERLRKLDHDHIAAVHGCGISEDDAYVYVAEEFLLGEPLSNVLSEDARPLTQQATYTLALALISALEHAHARGVLHGNLNPSDIWMEETGPKISGFGLARLREGRNLLQTPGPVAEPRYLSPEQIYGLPLDARVDLYALGTILYELTTGRTPFVGNASDVMRGHLDEPPAPLRELAPEVSRSFEHFVLKLLAKNPNDRYRSASQARRVLSALVSGVDGGEDPSSLRLVGRDDQLAKLQQYWTEANDGKGRLVFISGESGIGKTSLALQAAIESGAPLVLLGENVETERGLPFRPFSEALQRYLDTVPPELLDRQAIQLISRFSRLVPEVARTVPDLPEPPPLEPQEEQLRLISSVVRFIELATSSRPWVLILDDFQWADSGSMELLRLLGRRLHTMPLLVMCAYRDSEIDSRHPIQSVLRDFGEDTAYHHIELERLSRDSVKQMLVNLWTEAVPESLVDAICRQADGNPLYVEEVVKGLREDGLVAERNGVWSFPEDDSVRLPSTVYEAVERRIHYMYPEARDVLSQAAVLGQAFRLDDLVAMSRLPEFDVLDYLDMALEHQLIHEDAGGEHIRFRHVEIHRVICADLGSLRRRRLHMRAGEAILARSAADPEAEAGALAHHFDEAGDYERAIKYLLPAARQSQESYENDTALDRYKRALEILDRIEEMDPAYRRQRMHVLRSMGNVQKLIGKVGEAHASYQTAIELADELGDESFRAWCQVDLADLLTRQSRFDESVGLLDDALLRFDRLGESEGIAAALQYRGDARGVQGDNAAARADYVQSLELRETNGDLLGAAHLYNNLGIIANRTGNYDEAQSLFERGLAVHRQLNNDRERARLLNNLGNLLLVQKRVDEARELIDEAAAILREVGDIWTLAVSLHSLGQVLATQGDQANAELRFCESLEMYRDLGDQAMIARVLEDYAKLDISLGRYAEGLALIGAAQGIRQETNVVAGDREKIALDTALSTAESAVGAAAVDEAIALGRSKSVADVVDSLLRKVCASSPNP